LRTGEEVAGVKQIDLNTEKDISFSKVAKLFFTVFKHYGYQILGFFLLSTAIWIFFDLHKQIPMSPWLKQVIEYLGFYRIVIPGIFMVCMFFWAQLKKVPKKHFQNNFHIMVWFLTSGLMSALGEIFYFVFSFIVVIPAFIYALFPALHQLFDLDGLNFLIFIFNPGNILKLIPFLLLTAPGIWLVSRYFLFPWVVMDQVFPTASLYNGRRSFFQNDSDHSKYDDWFDRPLFDCPGLKINKRLTSIKPFVWFIYSFITFLVFIIAYKVFPYPYKVIVLMLLFIIRAMLNAIIYHTLTSMVKITTYYKSIGGLIS
jgi:hypothetical protein